MEQLMSQLVKDTVSCTIVPDNFGVSYDSEDVLDFYAVFEELMEISNCFSYGATKLVFDLKDSDYVLKIPFNCTLEEYNEIDEYYGVGDFLPDYCEKEANIYNDINANHPELKCFFAETFLYGVTKDGTPVYAQKKIAQPVCYIMSSDLHPSEESMKEVESNSNFRYLNRIWLALSLDTYGRELTEKLVSYIEDNDINDLHSGNIGYYDNGFPVIFDYAGYYE